MASTLIWNCLERFYIRVAIFTLNPGLSTCVPTSELVQTVLNAEFCCPHTGKCEPVHSVSIEKVYFLHLLVFYCPSPS